MISKSEILTVLLLTGIFPQACSTVPAPRDEEEQAEAEEAAYAEVNPTKSADSTNAEGTPAPQAAADIDSNPEITDPVPGTEPIRVAPTAAGPQSNEMRAQIEALQGRIELLESRLVSAEHKNFLKNGKPGIQVIGERATQVRGKRVDPELSVRAGARDPEAGFVQDSATKSYRQSMILFRGRKYAEAILAFSAFLQANADHPLAGSAQFYIGESYFRQKEYKLAITEYARVLTAYDRSPRIAQTLKQMAAAEEADGRTDDAKRHRQLLLSLFPQSPAAQGEAVIAKAPEQAPPAAAPVAAQVDPEMPEVVDAKSELKKAALDEVPPTAPINEPAPGSVQPSLTTEVQSSEPDTN